jgi:hypothetical protein
MEKFSAESFYQIGRDLAEIKAIAHAHPNASSLTEGDEWFANFFRAIADKCEAIGLRVSAKAALSTAADFAVGNSAAQELEKGLHILQSTLIWEMEDTKFFHMPSDRAQFYDCKEMFGAEVNSQFPEIQFDMIEAGNCYASGRGTACVFHLMRIMEVGVQRFGSKLNVTLVNEKNWQNILDEVNKAIKSLPPKDLATKAMSEASANLYAVKLAWRNEVMHPKDTYTLEESENLVRQVKLFMEQLASII